MPRLDERLSRGLRGLTEPVGRPDVLDRVRIRKERRQLLHRIQTAVLAVSVLAGSVTGTYLLARAVVSTGPDPVEKPPAPGAGAFDDLEPGWTELPPPPEVREGGATAWTGQELIMWSGYVFQGSSPETHQDDGFAFHPRSGRWRSLAPSPLVARREPASAWTGHEMLVWGGEGKEWRPVPADGAAYDPVADSWRMLPDAPIGARVPFFVWTGQEMVVWGSQASQACSNRRARDGAAYDPSTDGWRRIANAPIDVSEGTALWTGSEMIVFGFPLDEQCRELTETVVGAAYDPAGDTWRSLATPDLWWLPTMAWNGSEVVARDGIGGSQALDLRTNRWRALREQKEAGAGCELEAVSVEGFVLGEFCGFMELYDPETERWEDVRSPVAWGEFIPAHPAILLLHRNVDTGEERMFAYRPPPRASEVLEGAPAEPTGQDRAVIRSVIRFAKNPNPDAWSRMPLGADGVWLGLGERLIEKRTARELMDPEAWLVDEKHFRGYVGPFSALELLRDPERTTISIGPHPHCASPPVEAPQEVAGLRRVSVQGRGETDTCLNWFTVDLFLTEGGTIRAITLDLWEP